MHFHGMLYKKRKGIIPTWKLLMRVYLWILGTPKLDSILSPFKCILQHRFVLLGKIDSWKASLHPHASIPFMI